MANQKTSQWVVVDKISRSYVFVTSVILYCQSGATYLCWFDNVKRDPVLI